MSGIDIDQPKALKQSKKIIWISAEILHRKSENPL